MDDFRLKVFYAVSKKLELYLNWNVLFKYWDKRLFATEIKYLLLSVTYATKSFKIPSFIIDFILASCLFSFFPAYKSFYLSLYGASKQIIVVSLLLIGSGISIENLKKIGVKVVFQAVRLWIVVCLLYLYYMIHHFQP